MENSGMSLKKTCTCCKQEKPVEAFYANKRMKDGRNTFCIECHKADNIARKQKRRQSETFLEAEREQNRKRRGKNAERYNELTRQWRLKNTDHLKAYGQTYRSENKAFVNFLCQKRKLGLQHRTPAWLSLDDFWIIQEAYELAETRTKLFGFAWHVDHVIPLRGKRVSGLHVPLNLQVIPAAENQRKSNTFEVQDAA
jgi:5-methylcytosine-specific restriction endonuclease McrA